MPHKCLFLDATANICDVLSKSQQQQLDEMFPLKNIFNPFLCTHFNPSSLYIHLNSVEKFPRKNILQRLAKIK